MGLGILDDHKLAHVPGTVLLDEIAGQSQNITTNLKHGTGRDSHIILAPQPSNDPNDPLNWPRFRKDLTLAVLCFGSIINAATQGPLLSAGIVSIAIDLDVTPTDIALLSGYYLLVVGATGPFVSALATKFGKRPVFLGSSCFGVIGCIVSICASNYHQLLAGRIISGFSTSAYESVVLAVLGDLYFVHQRGLRMSITNFILAAVSNGVAIIAGPITANLGWKYLFYICLPFIVTQLILLVFFGPETTYRRAAIYDIDTTSAEDLAKLGEVEAREKGYLQENNNPTEDSAPTEANEYRPPPPPKTFYQRMAVYSGTYSSDSLIKMVLSSILIMTNIGASWVIFISGLLVAWYVAMSFIAAPLLSAPPYNFSAAGVGYTSVGPLLGGTLGGIFCSIIMDPMLKSLTRLNKGVYEPEFRVPLMIPAAIFTTAGLFGFGYAITSHVSIYLIAFIWGVVLFGITIAAIATSSYAVDAFRDNTTEIFIMAMVFKNFFFYGLSNFIITWTATSGPSQVFDVLGGVTIALFLTSLPLYIFGKRLRSFWHRYNVLKLLHLETDQSKQIVEG